MNLTTIHHIAIIVSDYALSKDFGTLVSDPLTIFSNRSMDNREEKENWINEWKIFDRASIIETSYKREEERTLIRWIHISDLHFNSDDMSTTLLRNELPKYLKRNSIRCDYVFCTGDIRIGRMGVFPDSAAMYLKELCAAVGVDATRLFIVPGNHDIDRNSPGRDEAIEQVMFVQRGNYNSKYGTIEDTALRTIHAGQTDFREFLGKVYDDDRLSYYSNPLVPHFNIETPDFNILHVDTTITQRAGQEATDLVIGTKALLTACESLNPEKPTILLTHFPFTCLLQDEKKYVSEILYRYGVRLWLAGHEHDHNLQPVKYLYSVQAGELQMEDNTHATVLIGEYDTSTHYGTISAHTWLPEGWAEYPIIWHDYAQENRFPFALRLPKDNGLSREAVLIQQANRPYHDRLPENVVESIIPDLEDSDERHIDSLQKLIVTSWNTDKPHIILLADGGMGKSTMLLKTCQKIENALYISLEGLVTIGYDVEEYIAYALFEGDRRRLQDFARSRYVDPSLILLVDGLNEVDGESERRFIRALKRLNMLKGIQIVISSRNDFTPRYSMSGYQIARLLPLTDTQISSVFTGDEWDSIQETPTLKHLLSNPMMVTMYKAVSPVIDQNRDVEFLKWRIPVQNASDLLHNYYVAQIAILLSREGINGDAVLKAVRCVFDILPYIAYRLESTYRFNVNNRELREMVREALGFQTFDPEMMEAIEEHFRTEGSELSDHNALDILIDELHLLHRIGDHTAFPHQIHRDYLSACWIVKETGIVQDLDSIWNSRELPQPVMEHIRQLSGRYWEGIAEKIHAVARKREDVFHLVGNLIDCFPYTGNSGVPDYSELDLRKLQLPNYSVAEGKIPLHGARIDDYSIGKRCAKPVIFTMLRFSEDNAYLATVRNNQVVIYSLQKDEQAFWYTLSGGIARLEFAGDYLFAVTKSKISIFKYDDGWTFTGEIAVAESISLFNKRLRSIVLQNDALYFYYNNRIRQFRLPDGAMLVNRQSQHAWENPVEGYDLSDLSKKQPRSRIKSQGIVSREEHNGLIATARDDGDLRINSGKELYYKLNRGITLLKDGAISGNGKWAATLSYEIFSGRRKIQYWNLDSKSKEKELYCPPEVVHIHLSQSGKWIFGETDKRCWVLNIETGKAIWFDEHFISNQHSKLVTYDDWIFRKNQNNDIYLYNLETEEVRQVENRSKNSRIATLMPDGSVASVGNNARKALLKNSRNGSEMQVNNDQTVVLGIYGLKKQPFVAIATENNLISIYHTGTGQRLRKLPSTVGNYIVSVHPEESVIACTDGRNMETFNFYEWDAHGEKHGRWYSNTYDGQGYSLNSSVLDIAFNDANHELVAILSNGEIVFCHEKYCKYHDKIGIITNFNVDAYDYSGCICSDEIKSQLKQNGAHF